MRSLARKRYVYTIIIFFITASLSSNVISISIRDNNETKTTSFGELEVYFIDVGQGDAIFIRTPENFNILIDAGSGPYGQTVVEFLRRHYVLNLDIFIASHPHEDHIGGCPEVFNSFKIKEVYHPGYDQGSATYTTFLQLIEDEGCTVYTDDEIDPGYTIDLPSIVYMQIIHLNKDASNANDASIVLRMDYNLVSFLFTGDIHGDKGDYVEEKITNDWDVNIDILKVAHHGSRDSSIDYFLDEATPDVSIIQVGQYNSYGHPHSEALQRLKYHNSQIIRTDLNGNIEVKTDGLNYFVYYDSPNEAPLTPVVTGTEYGQTGTEYMYEAITNDPNNDMIYYMWEWADGNMSDWQGPFTSSFPAYNYHTFSEEGAYIVKVKAKDIFGHESQWGTLNVVMPKPKEKNIFDIFQRLNLIKSFLQKFL